MTQPFERLDFLFKRIAQAVRTDANFFWTDEKRLVNGFPFENGKPLVYVFAWEVTYVGGLCSGFYLACEQVLWGTLAGGRAGGKRKESLQLHLWNLNVCIEKVLAKCWFVEMTLVMTSLPLLCVFQCLLTFLPIFALRWLVEIWQLSWLGAARKLEVKFKFQRRSCKLSFLPRSAAKAPWRVCSQASFYWW